MTTKTKTIIYWIATALLSFGMVGSGIAQIAGDENMIKIIAQVQFPLYIMHIIGIWKLLGVVAILIPKFPLLKEWAYAGFFFLMTGAFFSHLAVGDEVSAMLGPFFQSCFVVLSWYFRPANRKLPPRQ